MESRFNCKRVPWLKDYLTKRGIQASDQGRGKRKAELVELARKASEMKLRWVDEDEEELSDELVSKLRADKGTIPNPSNIHSWTCDFASMRQFTFADLHTYFPSYQLISPHQDSTFHAFLCKDFASESCHRLAIP